SRAENIGPEIKWGRFPLDAMAGLLLGVPILVLAGSIVSSTLFTPNFFDRSFLILSPFLWAFCARLYDESLAMTPGPAPLPLTLALSAVVLGIASLLAHPLPPQTPGLPLGPFPVAA